MANLYRILAVDPSLRGTGFALVEKQEKQVRALQFGRIDNPAKLKPSGCLLRIRDQLRDVILKQQPHAMAIESTIYVQSYATAIALGTARGAALLAAAEAGLPIYDYAPRKIKQAVVGRGTAQKAQVAFMIRATFGLTETPSHDAADALAIALTHLQSRDAAIAKRVELPTI